MWIKFNAARSLIGLYLSQICLAPLITCFFERVDILIPSKQPKHTLTNSSWDIFFNMRLIKRSEHKHEAVICFPFQNRCLIRIRLASWFEGYNLQLLAGQWLRCWQHFSWFAILDVLSTKDWQKRSGRSIDVVNLFVFAASNILNLVLICFHR
jgi:hypothetical protein